MLLLTVVYEQERDDIINEINNIKEQFKKKDVNIAASESIELGKHFIKLYSDKEIDLKLKNKFYLYISVSIYNIVVEEFCKEFIHNFLTDTYFFLKHDEIKEVKELSLTSLRHEQVIVDEDSIYCINKKNQIIDKIMKVVLENQDINIDGFITFRMKELKPELESIVDKIVEKYMVEKEYNEFIKLLKYFVEMQDSKLEEVHIVIQSGGNYLIQDREGMDIKTELFTDLLNIKQGPNANMEDMLISGLITNSPQKIKIHCAENCNNKEILETIEKVFTSRVQFCQGCERCSMHKSNCHKI